VPPVYDSLVSRVDAAGLLPEPEVIALQQALPDYSIALNLMRKVRMASGQAKATVLDSLPSAYWVSGDTGLKQTTGVSWTGKTLTAEEIAVIVPIPEAVIADVTVDLWAQIRPLIAAAIGRLLDAATVFGVNTPASFSQAIIPATRATTPKQAFAGAPLDAVSDALGVLEGAEVPVSSIVGRTTLRAAMRDAQAASSAVAPFSPAPDRLYGYPIKYPEGATAWPSEVTAIVGDWSSAVLGVRQDLTYKFLDQAVITDDAGKVILNLAQQDSIALRVVARYGFATADYLGVDDSGDLVKTFPFATALTAGTTP